jgi:hypothetical protein
MQLSKTFREVESKRIKSGRSEQFTSRLSEIPCNVFAKGLISEVKIRKCQSFNSTSNLQTSSGREIKCLEDDKSRKAQIFSHPCYNSIADSKIAQKERRSKIDLKTSNASISKMTFKTAEVCDFVPSLENQMQPGLKCSVLEEPLNPKFSILAPTIISEPESSGSPAPDGHTRHRPYQKSDRTRSLVRRRLSAEHLEFLSIKESAANNISVQGGEGTQESVTPFPCWPSDLSHLKDPIKFKGIISPDSPEKSAEQLERNPRKMCSDSYRLASDSSLISNSCNKRGAFNLSNACCSSELVETNSDTIKTIWPKILPKRAKRASAFNCERETIQPQNLEKVGTKNVKETDASTEPEKTVHSILPAHAGLKRDSRSAFVLKETRTAQGSEIPRKVGAFGHLIKQDRLKVGENLANESKAKPPQIQKNGHSEITSNLLRVKKYNLRSKSKLIEAAKNTVLKPECGSKQDCVLSLHECLRYSEKYSSSLLLADEKDLHREIQPRQVRSARGSAFVSRSYSVETKSLVCQKQHDSHPSQDTIHLAGNEVHIFPYTCYQQNWSYMLACEIQNHLNY